MKPKQPSLFPNLPHRKSTFLFGLGEQILDRIEKICVQQDKFGNDTKTFWFRFQNDIGTFVLSFLTLSPTALQRRNTEIWKQIFPEKEYRGLSPNFHICASVSDLYIPTIGLPILLEEICIPILGLLYKSLTDT